MKYEQPNMVILRLYETDIVVTSDKMLTGNVTGKGTEHDPVTDLGW